MSGNLKEQQADAEKLRLEHEHLMKLCYETFEKCKSGKQLLEKLKNDWLVASQVADPSKSESHAFYREGQNQVIRFFINAVEQYKKMGEKA